MNFSTLLLAGLLVLNAFISWWNAKQAGKVWLESKAVGGFPRLLAWSAAIQSACGFTMIIGFFLALLASVFHWLPPKYVTILLNLEYLLIVVPAIGSGLVITLHSWQLAFRDRSVANLGTAAYNTLATVHNVYDVATELPSVFDSVSGLFSGGGGGGSSDSSDSDDNNPAVMLVLILAVVAVAAGILLTVSIVRHNMGTVKLPTHVVPEPA